MPGTSRPLYPLLLLVLAAVLGNACVPPLGATEKNIIVFITDDEGKTLGCYGDTTARTPNIDALASDGILFHNAFATTASCSASRSVVLSGLHNHKNGQYGHAHHFHKFESFANVISLALPRVLANAGYRTARIGKYHVAPAEVYHFETVLKGNARNAVAMAEACQAFIADADDTRPFFLYFGTSDPHRGGGVDKTSRLALKPDLFGNKPNRKAYRGVNEEFFAAEEVEVPPFLSDTPETREELAQYYQSCSRVDQGLGRLVEILKEAGLYDKTLILFTSDHGMAFAGAKTTVYEPGLAVPLVVRNPYVEARGVESEALISHTDLTPTLVDFADHLDRDQNRPKSWTDPNQHWKQAGRRLQDNRSGGNPFDRYHGKSWLELCAERAVRIMNTFSVHTRFMKSRCITRWRTIRDHRYKLIWNIAHPLEYPFATDLWAAASWQAQLQKGLDAPYGTRSVGQYIHRPEFELYDMNSDPNESTNLAADPKYAAVLKEYQEKLKAAQRKFGDPWISKWKYE